jgi:hypothetical protein
MAEVQAYLQYYSQVWPGEEASELLMDTPLKKTPMLHFLRTHQK